MKHSIKATAIVGLLATGIAVSAHAGDDDNIENWRTVEGVGQGSKNMAANDRVAFPNQPSEIWDWRQKEGVARQKSVHRPHVHTGARNDNNK
jgi:hypothetical protein